MTPLQRGYRGFELAAPTADWLPAEPLAMQLAGPMAGLYAEEIRAAVAAVVYFFQRDMGRSTVSAAQFVTALSKALAGLGLSLNLTLSQGQLRLETDLRQLLAKNQQSGELAFFAQLRHHLRDQLRAQPTAIGYCGLRGCVKQLLGARRWTPRCQRLADQIVSFLRACLQADGQGRPRILVVQ